MSQTLYLFVTSRRPDQYINPALHCIEYENVDKVVFTYINDSMESTAKARSIPQEIYNRVMSLLSSLSQDGTYRYFDNKKDKENLLDIYKEEEVKKIKEFYTLFLGKNIDWSVKVIEYLDLKDGLTNIYHEERSCLFDVTALSNRHIADILAVSIIAGFHNIYTFELKEAPNFKEPWKSLFHELRARNQVETVYQHVNIVKTKVFRECTDSIFIRKLPLKVSLVLTPIFIIALLLINFFYGSTNWVIQTVGILSAVASLLSIIFSFFPPKK